MYSYTTSADLLERARKVLAGGVSSEFRKSSYPHALFYTHGVGSRIFDADSNEYLDFTLSQGPLILGHSHPNVLKAVEQYSQRGQLFAGQHIREIELAEKLNKLIPSAELMRFCLDGSEAVHTAFRIARAKTKKTKFLRFEGHYHGWLDNVSWGFSTASEEALGNRHSPEAFPWSQGLPMTAREEFILIPWNDADLLQEVIARHHQEIAAVISEPIMCNNGCILPEPGFLSTMRELCTRHNIALIFDEVITGFRTSLGGAQEYFNVVPDLAIFAKAMGNGYPISAIVGKKDWMLLVEESKVIHAGTLNAGNPSVAAALATIEVLERENVPAHLTRLGKILMEGIRNVAMQAGQNLLVQGPGPMFHTGFTDLKKVNDFRDTLQYDKGKLKCFVSRMHDEGIRIIGRGLWYISAAHNEEDVSRAISVTAKVLQAL